MRPYGFEVGSRNFQLAKVGDHFRVEQRVRDRHEPLAAGDALPVLARHLEELTSIPATVVQHGPIVFPFMPRGARGGGVG